MLSKLWGRMFRRGSVSARVSPGTRAYAVGDIHGRVDLLRDIHRLIREDALRAQAPRNMIVYLGDYIDRGPASRAVIDVLLDDPLPGFDRVHLKGNHDDCLLRFLSDPEIGRLWLSHGGVDTLRSYGIVPPRSLADIQEVRRAQHDLRQILPPRHETFFRELEPAYLEGDYFFVHAGVRPGVSLASQAEKDLLWIDEPFLNDVRDHGKMVVHGHSIVTSPQVRKNRIGVDTGAYVTGVLSCLVLWATEHTFLQTWRPGQLAG